MQGSNSDARRRRVVSKFSGSSPSDGENWSNLLRHVHAPVYVCSAAGLITHFNDRAVSLWGRTPEVGKDMWCGSWRIYRTDGIELPLDQCPMAIAIREQRPLLGEVIVVERPDGIRRTVQVYPDPIFDASGTFKGAVNLLIDITEYKDANYTQGRLAAIVQSSDDAIVSKNLDGVITSWNLGAQRLFGYSAEEAIGKPITLLIPQERINEEPEVLARIRRGESVDHYETVRKRKDGSFVDISLTVSPIFDVRGKIIGASKIARDISDRKHAERTLLDEDRRKDEFIATLAHELRNPLAPLKTSLQLIRMTGFNGQVSRSTLEMMERQVNHLVRLVEDLLDLSRLKHGAIVLKKETLYIADVVSDALEIVAPLVESREHHLEVSLPSHALSIFGDRTRLVQILANLLNNAAKFTPPQGLIRLIVEGHGSDIYVRCADNGPGIPPDMHEVIFNMFTQVQASGAGIAIGMGIGLSLVKHLVDLHGGSIRVQSEGLGKGSEFILCLPLDAKIALPVASVSTPAGSNMVASASRRLLIVDDNRDAAESLARLFEILGHEVHTANSGLAAINLSQSIVPDVVFLDIDLPDMTGHDVAARLRQESWGKSILLVALTGWGQEKDRQQSAASGFDLHFVKPVEFDKLVMVLNTGANIRH